MSDEEREARMVRATREFYEYLLRTVQTEYPPLPSWDELTLDDHRRLYLLTTSLFQGMHGTLLSLSQRKAEAQ